ASVIVPARCPAKAVRDADGLAEVVILPADFAILCVTPGLQLTPGIPVQRFPATIRVDNACQSRAL
ncbi:hypothetical protein, partial [Pectobacterium parmentieri]|uniref:hypothetical protein n=1 Tax=Pectobacterium parmentieri TaxID=1905730 RepID=UPI001E362684